MDREKGDDVQVVTQSPRAEVTTQVRISAKDASDCLVAVFFLHTSMGKGSVIGVKEGQTVRRGLAYRFLR